MSLKKYFVRSIILFALLPLTFLSVAFAQTEENSSLRIPQIFVDQINLQISKPTAGDTVYGTFTLINSGDFDGSNIYYQISLVGDYRPDELADKFYDSSEMTGPEFVKAGSQKTISFKYKLPETVFGKGLGIQIGAFTGSGIALGWSDYKLSINPKAGVKMPVTLDIKSLALKVGTSTFTVQQGPTVSEKNMPQLVITLASLPTKPLTIIPKIDLFNGTAIGASISSTTISPIILTSTSSKTFSIILPVASEPKVYEARVNLASASGEKLAKDILVRYIVAGDIVSIHSLSSDKQQLNKGEEFNITFTYTGAPSNILTGQTIQQQNHLTNINIFNEYDELVAKYSGVVNYSEETSQIVGLTAQIEAKALRAEMLVTNSASTTLAKLDVNLSDDYSHQKRVIPLDIPWIPIVAIIVIILALILLLVFRKSKTAGTMMVVLIIAAASLSFHTAHAQYVQTSAVKTWSDNDISGYGYKHTVTMSGPSSKRPGATDLYFKGSVQSISCNNEETNFKVSVTYHGVTKSYVYKTGERSGHDYAIRTAQFSVGPFTVPANATAATDSGYVVVDTTHIYGDGIGHYVTKGNYKFILRQPPTSGVGSCPIPGETATISWSPVSNAISYALIIHDTTGTDNFDGLGCTAANTVGDHAGDPHYGCIRKTTPAFHWTPQYPDHTYTWWVYAKFPDGYLSVSGPKTYTNNTRAFKCASAAPTSPELDFYADPATPAPGEPFSLNWSLSSWPVTTSRNIFEKALAYFNFRTEAQVVESTSDGHTCTAVGDWSGNKTVNYGGSASEDMDPISTTKTYVLRCDKGTANWAQSPIFATTTIVMDLCSNRAGDQTSVPTGDTVNEGGICCSSSQRFIPGEDGEIGVCESKAFGCLYPIQNTAQCDTNNETGLTQNVTSDLVNECPTETTLKCLYQCDTGFVPNENMTACVADGSPTQVGSKCGATIKNTGEDAGTVDYKDTSIANINQLVTWRAFNIESESTYTWKKTENGAVVREDATGIYPISYPSVGRQTMWLKINDGEWSQCAPSPSLQIVNNPNFKPF